MTPSTTTVIGVSALTIKVTICTLFHDAAICCHLRLARMLTACYGAGHRHDQGFVQVYRRLLPPYLAAVSIEV
jgi:hypothetical protein